MQSCRTLSALRWDYYKHSNREAPAARRDTHSIFHSSIVFLDAGRRDKPNIERMGMWRCQQRVRALFCCATRRQMLPLRTAPTSPPSHSHPLPAWQEHLCPRLAASACSQFTSIPPQLQPSRECIEVFRVQECPWEWAQQFVIPKLFAEHSVFY